MLGDAVFRDLMSQYDVFLKARADVLAQGDGGAAPASAASGSADATRVETALQ
jgi:hypothetical protein